MIDPVDFDEANQLEYERRCDAPEYLDDAAEDDARVRAYGRQQSAGIIGAMFPAMKMSEILAKLREAK